jgi:hypothetical protein
MMAGPVPLLALLLAAPAAALSSYTVHNASDCCCDNLEPRSSKNLGRRDVWATANRFSDSPRRRVCNRSIDFRGET